MIVFVLLTSLFIWFYINKLKAKTKYVKSDIAKKDADIERLSEENTLLNAKINHFQSLIDIQKSEFEKIYCVGHKLYTDIISGRSIASWSSDEEKTFVEYYKIADFKFVHNLEEEYNNLSDHYKVILILEKLVENRQKRLDILGIAASSYRSAKSRIEALKCKDF